MHVLPDWFPLLQKVLQAFFIVLSYNNQTFCKMSRDKIEFMRIKPTTFDVASTILYCLRFCISRKCICYLFILYLIYAALHATEKHPEKSSKNTIVLQQQSLQNVQHSYYSHLNHIVVKKKLKNSILKIGFNNPAIILRNDYSLQRDDDLHSRSFLKHERKL